MTLVIHQLYTDGMCGTQVVLVVHKWY